MMIHRFQEYARATLSNNLFHKYIYVPQVEYDLSQLTPKVTDLDNLAAFRKMLIEYTMLAPGEQWDASIYAAIYQIIDRPLLRARLDAYIFVTSALDLDVVEAECYSKRESGMQLDAD